MFLPTAITNYLVKAFPTNNPFEQMNKKWICSERPITICATVKGWLSQGSRIWPKCDVTREKVQLGLLYRLHYRQTCAPACTEHDLLVIRRSQVIQVDRLVSYPLVFIHLRLKEPRVPTNRYHNYLEFLTKNSLEQMQKIQCAIH